jgi:hypothetical protein
LARGFLQGSQFREYDAAGGHTMRIGCIFTVKNEEDLITQNINYHRFMGATDFFVFLDHSTDRTKDILQDIPGLRMFENLSYSDLLAYNLDKPELDLGLISPRFAAHNGVRQVFYANMALELCRAENIDWLINLDPDELICINLNQVEKDSLKEFFLSLDKSVGAVIFRNVEVVPTKMEPKYVYEDRLFKNCQLDGDLTGLPKTEIFNPYTGAYTPAGWFWGHTSGKLAVRVLPHSYFTHLTHLFHTDGEIKTVDFLLHYNIFSYKQFLNKYRNFQNFPRVTSLGRPVRPLRTLLVELVNDGHFSNDYLADYYRQHILYSPEDIELIRKKHGSAFIEINSVSSFFKLRLM